MSKSGNREIEFLGERDASVVPVEVKASRGSTVSLDEVLGHTIHTGTVNQQNVCNNCGCIWN